MKNNNNNQQKKREANFWDKIAGERVYAAFSEKQYDEVFEDNLNGKNKGLAVDLGCAAGVSAVMLARRGFEVVGIDISPQLIKQAKKLWEKEARSLKFKVGDAEKMPFKDKSCDVIFLGGVVHHFPDYSELMKEIRRVLKKGGLLLMIEPNRLDFIERFSWFWAGKLGKISPNEYPISPVELKNRLSKDFSDFKMYPIRMDDIPFYSFLPLIGRYFRGGKGRAIKLIPLTIINIFRPKIRRGNFFVLSCIKKQKKSHG